MADYYCILAGYIKRGHEKWRHTRELIAVHTKATGKQIFPLPGDYDHIPTQESQEEKLRILNKHGLLDLIKK